MVFVETASIWKEFRLEFHSGGEGNISPHSFNNSWKSENRVSKSKIEFSALASI